MAVATRTPLIAGNWKMNLDHLQAVAFVQKLHWTLKDAKHDVDSVEVAVFPPFTDLRTVQTLLDADKIPFALGAQDISTHDSGAYTGEVSGAFLAKLDKDRNDKGCEYAVLVSMLEEDSELYTGITDVSHEYPKMFVVRPQFFLAIIALLRNAAQPHPLEAHRVDSLAMFYASIGDGKEGVAAFLEKRDPQFTGRASQMPPFYPWE